MKTKTKKKIFNSQNHLFYKIDQESVDLKDLSKELIKANQDNNPIFSTKKGNNSLKDYIKKLYYLSNLKIRKKYNCTPTKYENYIIDYLLNNADCHLVSIFKEKMLTDYIDEFLRRKYSIIECKERIPKFAIYYKNYLQFFCKPTYNNFKFNDLIQNYGEKKAELYYKDHYQGGISNDDEDNGFEESSSEESSNKENELELNNNNNGEIFSNVVKEKIDNVTVMTTINTTGNNTINLNINNEKIEVFSENKAEVSNDTTINDIMEDIKIETRKLKNKKKEDIKNKFKSSYKKILNYSLKYQEKSKDNKNHKNISIESKKKANSKDYSKKNILSKGKKDINKEKEKLINNEKMLNQKIKSQIFKYNVESHKINKNNLNKMTHNKIQKILKNRYTKNSYNFLYDNNFNKESHINIRNTSSNIKSTDNKQNKKNSLSGLTGKKVKYKSRNNNFDSLYKYITVGTNTTTNKSSNINFQTTNINKNSIPNLAGYGNNIFKTMNFIQNSHHQRTNSQLIKKQSIEKNKNKLQAPNIYQDRKTSSLKMLVTDSGNPGYPKHAIKIKKNEKLKSKASNANINNKNIIINNNENNLNNKITVTTNNYFNNLNNRYNKKTTKKTLANSNDRIIVNNHNYSNLVNQMSDNQLLYNNEDLGNLNKKLINNNYHTKSNGNLMQIALSLLIESNSPSKQINNNLQNTLNSNNNTSLNNNNYLIKNNIINQKNIRNSYNNNAPTHYNININNQINIKLNNKGNNKNVVFKRNKKNNTNKKKLNINVGDYQRKNFSKKKTTINTISNNKLLIIPNFNKNKIRTRNYNVSLKNGLTQYTNYNGRNEKVIKGYHTKSVSNLTDLINHNKKLISLYKSLSKSKSKEKK